ncbi:MAG: preprotein translocase subunit SecG [Muribaculaceae bacterium]|nr:preprotein translocase subunit SecG [Muribaculaceae bacterium]MBR6489310.1 preprotein translocase subunit SecG [Muribaculaceae bacterium]
MEYIISALIFLASILLVGVVLIQKSKGGGLAASASNYNQFMGVRKTTDFIEKATWGLAIFICVLSIASAFISKPTLVQGSQTSKFEDFNANAQPKNEQATPYPTATNNAQQPANQDGAK